MRLRLPENQVLFEINGCRIISKLLSGEHIITEFIPDKFETEENRNKRTYRKY